MAPLQSPNTTTRFTSRASSGTTSWMFPSIEPCAFQTIKAPRSCPTALEHSRSTRCRRIRKGCLRTWQRKEDFSSQCIVSVQSKEAKVRLTIVSEKEAMWICFESNSTFAIKGYVGGINTVSGEPALETMQTSPRGTRTEGTKRSRLRGDS